MSEPLPLPATPPSIPQCRLADPQSRAALSGSRGDVRSIFRELRSGEFNPSPSLAIALKRRVIVLQAVDHSQGDDANPFEHFVKSLKGDHQRVDELEAGIDSVLMRLSALHLRAPAGLRQRLMPRGDVDELMRASYRLRELGTDVAQIGKANDVVIQIARHNDGSVLVLPAVAA
jgi:hypothetical protein